MFPVLVRVVVGRAGVETAGRDPQFAGRVGARSAQLTPVVDRDRLIPLAVDKEERSFGTRAHDIDRTYSGRVDTEGEPLHKEDAWNERRRHPGLGRKVLG